MIKLPVELATITPVADGSGLWGLKTVYVCLIAAGIDTVFIALVTTLVFLICCRSTKAPAEKPPTKDAKRPKAIDVTNVDASEVNIADNKA